MGRGNADEQTDVLHLVDPRIGERLLEQLLEAGARVSGVEPSEQMLAMTRRRIAAAVRDGRADLRIGTAERTGFPDATFDAVVSVNTVALWTDLPGALAELRRVVRPGGRVVISWHGGSRPGRLVRSLALPEDQLRHIEDHVREAFGHVDRHVLTSVIAFTTTRRDTATLA